MSKIRVSNRQELLSILRENGFYPIRTKKHQKWTNGKISVTVQNKHSTKFSRMCAERILKQCNISLKELAI